MQKRPPRAMTIAGSDSGAGAGIQADLKTFAALGVYGTSVLTAVTAQNTRAVTQVLELSPDLVAAQFDAVMADIGADAIKTGMLPSAAIIEVVGTKLREHRGVPVVIDPVMEATSGARLLAPFGVAPSRSRVTQSDAVAALRGLLSLATVVTPNAPEAAVLSGRKVGNLQEAREAARAIHALGPKAVVVKGGHLGGSQSIDLLYDGVEFVELAADRVDTSSTHGTGCTFASAIAAGLAQGLELRLAVAQAKQYVTDTMRHAFPLGGGHGPLNHFYRWWEKPAPP